MPFLNLIPETFAPFKQEAHKIFDETLALFKSHVDDVSLSGRVVVDSNLELTPPVGSGPRGRRWR